MYLLRFTFPLLAALPLYASADVCDTYEKWGGGSAVKCRANAAMQGASITDNWITYKPVKGRDPATGKSGVFTSTSTPATHILGMKSGKFTFLYLECFNQKLQMRIDVHNPSAMALKDKLYTFKIDDQAPFTENWVLNLSDKSNHSPLTSALPSKLKGANKLQMTWQSWGKTEGYVFALDGYDKASASLCK